MAADRMAVLEMLRKLGADGDVDFLREGVRVLAAALMEAEITELTGVPKGERAPERRLTNRNGYRERRWDTRVGTIDLAIPRVRDGSYFPSLLEPRRRAERALLAVVCEAYVGGVSTRRVEDLVAALGVASLSKSEVSRMCAPSTPRSRPSGRVLWPASCTPTCGSTPPTSRSATVAGSCRWPLSSRSVSPRPVNAACSVLELAAGNDEGNAWAPFLSRLVERGLAGVRLVISDAHRGLVRAVDEMLLGAAWQRCRVHFTRNAQALVPRASASMVATVIRSIFEQPSDMSAAEQLRRVAEGLDHRFPAVAALLREAEMDLLAHFTFPASHRRQIRSTNPLERLNKEIKRRTSVVGIFPTRASLIRLVGTVLAEQDDEWQDGRRYFSPESMALIDEDVIEDEEVNPAQLMAS